MKKVVIEIKELIEDNNGIKKYKTNINNLFVYKVQLGGGYATSILDNQKNHPDFMGEKSLIITYKEYINNNLHNPVYTHFTYGIKTKYNWDGVLPKRFF